MCERYTGQRQGYNERTEYMCVNDIQDNDRVRMKGRNMCVDEIRDNDRVRMQGRNTCV